jgi:hypothetical protein
MAEQAGQQATRIKRGNSDQRHSYAPEKPAAEAVAVQQGPALKAEVNHRLNEWRNDQWSATLEFLDPEDQSLWRMRVPTPSLPWSLQREWLSQTLRKPKPLQIIWRRSFSRRQIPAVIETVDSFLVIL